ncbi:uncharacterized protein BDV17DRAFT_293262 [Aspergillus undulatus]|uniref:uncharacterized protein n=1 Tax=Aspergillus undulatus TaxID=1810928 RepID=UPI003CCD2967
MPSTWLDLYIGIGQSASEHHQRHWALILAPHGHTTNVSIFHITGGPADYQHSAEAGQSIHNHPFAYLAPIGSIPSYMQLRVFQITHAIVPRRCQEYTVEVLAELEYQGLIRFGTVRYFWDMVGESMWEVACRTRDDECDTEMEGDGNGDGKNVQDRENPVSPADFVQLGDMARFVGKTRWSEVDALIRSDPAQRCQSYVAAVLEKLAWTVLLASGTFAWLARATIEPSLYDLVKADPYGSDSAFALLLYALYLRYGGLKKEMCYY